MCGCASVWVVVAGPDLRRETETAEGNTRDKASDKVVRAPLSAPCPLTPDPLRRWRQTLRCVGCRCPSRIESRAPLHRLLLYRLKRSGKVGFVYISFFSFVKRGMINPYLSRSSFGFTEWAQESDVMKVEAGEAIAISDRPTQTRPEGPHGPLRSRSCATSTAADRRARHAW